MVAAKSVISNTISQVANKFITALGAFLVTLLVTRYLGVSGYGDYTIVLTYLTLFFVMLDFGINGIFLRDYATSQSKYARSFLSLILLRIIIAVFFVTASLLLLPILRFNASDLGAVRLAIVFGSLFLLAQGINYSLQAAVLKEGRFDKLIWSSFFGSLLNVFLVWYGITHQWGLTWLVVSSVFSMFLSDFILLALLEKSWYLEINWREMGVLFKSSWSVGLSLVFNVLLTNIDKFLLSFFTPSHEVGLFGLSSKIFETTLVLPTFFVTALYPVILEAKRVKIENYKERLSWGVEVCFMLALPVCFFCFIFAPSLLNLLGGKEFVQASFVLRALLVPTIIFYLTSLLRAVIVAEGKDNTLPLVYGLGFLVDLVLNLILIKPYGMLACAFVNGISEGLILVMLAVTIRKAKLIKLNFKRFLAVLFSAGTVGLFWMLVQNWHWLPSLLLGVLIYLALLAYFRLITRETFRV